MSEQLNSHVLAYHARNPFVMMQYSPQLRGRARQYSAGYRAFRVVKTTDGLRPTAVNASTVVEVVRDVGAVPCGTTERSEGFRAKRDLQLLTAHLNRLHHHAMGWAPLTIAEIDRQDNAELQREMIDAIGGLDRYAKRAKFTAIHSDETGVLMERKMKDRAPIRAVAVTCPSTGRRYLLRVPPATATAKAGVAWTFGLTESEYTPTDQS